MDDESIEKIYRYNILWLLDEKNLGDVIKEKIENVVDRIIKPYLPIEELRRIRNRTPEYAKGSLLDNMSSLALKRELRFRFFGINILPEVIGLSKSCVIKDFYRYQPCEDEKISRNLISFFTTKNNGFKLQYLKNQEVDFEYLSINYERVQYSKVDALVKQKKDFFFQFRTVSPGFVSHLIKGGTVTDPFYFIPVEMSADARNIKGKKVTAKRIVDMKTLNIASERSYLASLIEKLKFFELSDEESQYKLENLISETRDENLKAFLISLTQMPKDEREKQLEVLKTQVPALESKINLVIENQVPLRTRKKRLKEKIENVTKKLNASQSKLLDLTVSKEFKVYSNFYYKKLFEDFKKRVEKRTGVKIDLDEWCFCVVFSPRWCDKENIPYDSSSRKLVETVELPSRKLDTREKNIFYETEQEAKYVDLNLIYFLTETFKQRDVEVVPFFVTIGEMDSFDRIFKSFQKYDNGGYWVRKIIMEGKKYVEKSEGPYTEQDAKIRAKILNNIITLKNEIKVAEVYSFSKLACDLDPRDEGYRKGLEKYVKVEDRFFPPPGAKIFCLIKGFSDIVYFKRNNLTKDFIKFSNYAVNSGMNYFNVGEYLVYYNPDSTTSLQKSSELKKVVREESNFTSGEFLWLLDAVVGKKIKRGNEPKTKPFPIFSELERGGIITFNTFIKNYKLIEDLQCSKEKLRLSFENIEKLVPSEYVKTYKNQDFDIKKVIDLNLVENETDELPKKFKIIRDFNGIYRLGMIRERKKLNNINLITVEDIKDCSGRLVSSFKNVKDKTWEVSKLQLFSGDTFFNDETVLICLTLFVSKLFGLKEVTLNMEKKFSECNPKMFYYYYYVYYLAYGNFDKFEELGFEIRDETKIKKELDLVRKSQVLKFVVDNKLNTKVPRKLSQMTIYEICKDFMTLKNCKDSEIIGLTSKISDYLFEKVKLEIFVDLEKRSPDFFLRYIIHKV